MQISNLHSDWQQLLNEQKKLPYFKKIEQNLAKIKQQSRVLPEDANYFKALELTPSKQVKVVILGQDPYHQPGQAHGLCFSVPQGVKMPPSLKNIFKAMHYDIQKPLPLHGDLSAWAMEGVLLLNTIFTVSQNRANSHCHLGWQHLTAAIIQYLSDSQQHIVFLLWGKQAQSYQHGIDAKHTILTAPHPSPLSAYRGFLTCKHFSKANRALLKNQQTIINW